MGLKSIAGTLMREEASIEWGHIPVIPTIQEAEVGESQVQNQPAGTREMDLQLKALIALARGAGFGSQHLHGGS